MSLSSAGILTVADDIIIGDGKTIGSASDPDAITIASGGGVTFTQTPVFPDGSLALADLDIDGGTDIGADIADADLFIVDDGAGGTNRKTTAARIKTYVGGGSFTLLKTIDASTASTVEFIDGASGVVLDGTYDNYVVRGTGVITSTTAGVVIRLREGSSFISSTDYDTVSHVIRGAETSMTATGSTGSAYIRGSWQRYSNSTTGFSTNFEAKFFNLPSTSLFKQVYYSGCNTGNDGNDFSMNHAAGLLDRSGSRTGACTGIQFLATGGTLSGKFSLYGVTT